jgi:cytochrome c oxidase subunit 1
VTTGAEERSVDATHRRVIVLLVVVPMLLLPLGIYFGVVQSLARAGVLHSGTGFGGDYYRGLTLHGVINTIVFTTLFEVAFGYAIVAHYLRCGFNPAVTVLSVALMLAGTLMAAAAMLSGRASVLYTFYPPLRAHPLFYVGAALLVVGSWIPLFQWIPAYRAWRREHRGERPPLAVVGMLATFTIWLTCTLPLAYEVLVLLLPWSLGLVPTVNVVLARTLFWFFGHALVYFWLLPAYVMFYVMLPALAGGKLYSDAAGRLAFLSLLVLSVPVGVHHQFADPGISASLKWFQGVLTFGVVVPSLMTAFTLAASLEHAARRRGATGLFRWWGRLPYLDPERYLFAYFIAGLWLFALGGITGIINASMSMNNVVHNTTWVPAHFHTTIAGPVFLAFIGMSLHLMTQLTGKQLRLPLVNLVVPYAWFGGMLVFSLPQSVVGLLGAPRRTDLGPTFANSASPLYEAHWVPLLQLGAIGAAILGLAMMLYFLVFFVTLASPRRREPALAFPTAEAYHDARLAVTDDLAPWVVASVLLVVIAYAPPLYQVVTSPARGAPAYEPTSPIAIGP